MPKASFVQADIERLIRAARKAGAVIKFDMRTFEATIIPNAPGSEGNAPVASEAKLAPDGRENWPED